MNQKLESRFSGRAPELTRLGFPVLPWHSAVPAGTAQNHLPPAEAAFRRMKMPGQACAVLQITMPTVTPLAVKSFNYWKQ